MSEGSGVQVALLTGQSDMGRWALSPLQVQFLDHVVPSTCMRVDVNFPYRPESPSYKASSLLSASLSNGWMYFRSRSRAFCEARRAGVIELIRRRETTVFLAGSCGLELFNNLHLPEELMHRASIFAFGPVARRRPRCTHVLVGSVRDRLSGHFFPAPDYLMHCGHLDYLAEPTVRVVCREFIQRILDVRPAKRVNS